MGGAFQGPAALTWIGFVESWHEFYLMAGTAAVTLAGLLFVAISLHVEALVHESREHLLGLARVTLFSFVFVLMVALMMLVPHQGMRPRGASLAAIGVAFFAVTFRQLRSRGVDHADFSGRLFRRRLWAPMVGYAGTAAVGVMLLRGRAEALYYLIAITCLLLGNAAGTSWDLLVRVARIRRRGTEADRERG